MTSKDELQILHSVWGNPYNGIPGVDVHGIDGVCVVRLAAECHHNRSALVTSTGDYKTKLVLF